MHAHCYLIFNGRVTGFFDHWHEVVPHIEHYRDALFRRYEDADTAFADWEKFEQTGVVPKKKYPKTTVVRSYLKPDPPKPRNLKKRAKATLKYRAAAAIATGGPIGSRTITCKETECAYPYCRCA